MCAPDFRVLLLLSLLPLTLHAAPTDTQEPPAQRRHKKGEIAGPKEPEKPPADAALLQRQDRATELTERAYKLQRKGAVNDAIKLYQEALSLDPLPKRFYNLGIPLEQAGRLAEALSAYRSFQRDDQGELPEYRKEVDERIDALVRRLGRVTVSVAADDEARLSVARAGEHRGAPRLRLRQRLQEPRGPAVAGDGLSLPAGGGARGSS